MEETTAAELLAANYNHKKAQADSLRAQIEALERVGEKNA